MRKLSVLLDEARHRDDSCIDEADYGPKWDGAIVELVRCGSLGGSAHCGDSGVAAPDKEEVPIASRTPLAADDVGADATPPNDAASDSANELGASSP